MQQKFEDILNVADPELQFHLLKVKDEIIAFAISDVESQIRQKILNNIGSSRRDRVMQLLKQGAKIPNRTKTMAKMVLTKAVFDVKDDEVIKRIEEALKKSGGGQPGKLSQKDYIFFINKMRQSNPLFKRAFVEKEIHLGAEYIRRGLSSKRDKS